MSEYKGVHPTFHRHLLDKVLTKKWKSEHEHKEKTDIVGEEKGQLNPDWTEWLMGWPICWTSINPIKKMIWFDWSIDPANNDKKPEKYPTTRSFMAFDAIRKKESRLRNIEDVVYEKESKHLSVGLVPRTKTDIKDRRNRLQAIGNGQVPQCMAKAFEILIRKESSIYEYF